MAPRLLGFVRPVELWWLSSSRLPYIYSCTSTIQHGILTGNILVDAYLSQ